MGERREGPGLCLAVLPPRPAAHSRKGQGERRGGRPALGEGMRQHHFVSGCGDA